jgi:hypothetical protein
MTQVQIKITEWEWVCPNDGTVHSMNGEPITFEQVICFDCKEEFEVNYGK